MVVVVGGWVGGGVGGGGGVVFFGGGGGGGGGVGGTGWVSELNGSNETCQSGSSSNLCHVKHKPNTTYQIETVISKSKVEA